MGRVRYQSSQDFFHHLYHHNTSRDIVNCCLVRSRWCLFVPCSPLFPTSSPFVILTIICFCCCCCRPQRCARSNRSPSTPCATKTSLSGFPRRGKKERTTKTRDNKNNDTNCRDPLCKLTRPFTTFSLHE